VSISRLPKHIIRSRLHQSNHKRYDSPLCCSDSDTAPIVICRYETLTALLESNELGTVSEFNVFLAAMRWVDADECREHFLDEVLGLVRFPTMDYEELGLVGKHPTAAGAAILKVCPTVTIISEMRFNALSSLTQPCMTACCILHNTYDPGISLGSANQCILGDVFEVQSIKQSSAPCHYVQNSNCSTG